MRPTSYCAMTRSPPSAVPFAFPEARGGRVALATRRLAAGAAPCGPAPGAGSSGIAISSSAALARAPPPTRAVLTAMPSPKSSSSALRRSQGRRTARKKAPAPKRPTRSSAARARIAPCKALRRRAMVRAPVTSASTRAFASALRRWTRKPGTSFSGRHPPSEPEMGVSPVTRPWRRSSTSCASGTGPKTWPSDLKSHSRVAAAMSESGMLDGDVGRWMGPAEACKLARDGKASLRAAPRLPGPRLPRLAATTWDADGATESGGGALPHRGSCAPRRGGADRRRRARARPGRELQRPRCPRDGRAPRGRQRGHSPRARLPGGGCGRAQLPRPRLGARTHLPLPPRMAVAGRASSVCLVAAGCSGLPCARRSGARPRPRRRRARARGGGARLRRVRAPRRADRAPALRPARDDPHRHPGRGDPRPGRAARRLRRRRPRLPPRHGPEPDRDGGGGSGRGGAARARLGDLGGAGRALDRGAGARLGPHARPGELPRAGILIGAGSHAPSSAWGPSRGLPSTPGLPSLPAQLCRRGRAVLHVAVLGEQVGHRLAQVLRLADTRRAGELTQLVGERRRKPDQHRLQTRRRGDFGHVRVRRSVKVHVCSILLEITFAYTLPLDSLLSKKALGSCLRPHP